MMPVGYTGRKRFKKAQAKLNQAFAEWADNIVPSTLPVHCRTQPTTVMIEEPEPVDEYQVPIGGVEINMDILMPLCDLQDGSKKINEALFKKVVEYLMTGVRTSVREIADATGVLVNHVGLIVNRLTDAGYLRVWRGHGGGSNRHVVNKFMLVSRPEFEPLYQLDHGTRPANVGEAEFPRWGDDIGPLIDAYGGYTRRLK